AKLNALLPSKHHGRKSEILMIPPNRPWITAARRVEKYMLHASIKHLKRAIESHCHFCTLIWDGTEHWLAPQSSSDPVWLWITRDEMGRLCLGTACGHSPRLEDYGEKTLLKFS